MLFCNRDRNCRSSRHAAATARPGVKGLPICSRKILLRLPSDVVVKHEPITTWALLGSCACDGHVSLTSPFC
jgi:hypothetical protein